MQEVQAMRVPSLGGEIPWRREWLPTPALLPGESHEQKSLVGYGPRGHKKSDMTEATEHSYMAQGTVFNALR